VSESQDAPEAAIVELFRHNLWANLRLLNACESLTPSQLDATAVGTYGSIYDTLLHIVGSEEWYLSGLSILALEKTLQSGERPLLAGLRDHQSRVGEGLIQVAPGVKSGDLARWETQRGVRSMPAPRLLTQIINHATEHRAQVNVILTQVGVPSVDFSGWAYHRAQP
jgi:uncharacterized damage-inducible protein DinB